MTEDMGDHDSPTCITEQFILSLRFLYGAQAEGNVSIQLGGTVYDFQILLIFHL